MIPKPIFISQLGEGKLFAMPHPPGGVYLHGALTHLAETGITSIVSLLDEFDISVLGLAEEEYICQLRSIDFLHLPIKDRSAPIRSDEYLEAVNKTYDHIVVGGNAVVHCWAGCGRTGLFNASLLVRHGAAPEAAFQQVSEARGAPVPDTQVQVEWVFAHRDILQS